MKRPLCLASVVFLGIWLFLAGGLQFSEDQKPSPLEQYTRGWRRAYLTGNGIQKGRKTGVSNVESDGMFRSVTKNNS